MFFSLMLLHYWMFLPSKHKHVYSICTTSAFDIGSHCTNVLQTFMFTGWARHLYNKTTVSTAGAVAGSRSALTPGRILSMVYRAGGAASFSLEIKRSRYSSRA